MKVIYFSIGFFIAAFLSAAVSTFAFNLKDIPYPYSEYEPGEFIDENTQFNTYEQLCSGYYIIDYSNKNKIKYTGYGDLDFKYTYEEYISNISTTTDTI